MLASGRSFVIPVELRRNLGIKTEDSLEIFVDGQYIMLKKYEPSCVFCVGVGAFVCLAMSGGDHRQQYLGPEGVKLAFRLYWL